MPADAARIRALRLRALRSDPDAFFSTLDLEEDRSTADWARQLEAPGNGWFVAVDLGRATRTEQGDVGLAAAIPYRRNPADLQVVSVWVDASARRRGVARALTGALVDHARSSGADGLCLWVADDNAAAVSLYAGLGFEATGRTGAFPAPRSFPEHERRLPLR